MSTISQSSTTQQNPTLDTAVIAIIACAVIGTILALIIIIICLSAKCTELKEHKRKADVVEKQLEVVEQVQNLALEAREIAELEELKLAAEQQQEAEVENMQQEQEMAQQNAMTGGYYGGMMPQGNVMMVQPNVMPGMMYSSAAGNPMTLNPQVSMGTGMMSPMSPVPTMHSPIPAMPSAQGFQPRAMGSVQMAPSQPTHGVSRFPGLPPIEQGVYGDYYPSHYYN